MTDPIADFLTRIRNAQLAKQVEVMVTYSKFKYSLAQLLEREGWLMGMAVTDGQKTIKLLLKYDQGQPVMQTLKRVSKPGRRVYQPFDKLPRVKNGFGMSIISTSKGLMSDAQARKAHLGGEIVCEIA